MNELSDMFEAVKVSTKARKDRRQAIRDKITAQGPADVVFADDDGRNNQLRMWKIKGGVVEIHFRTGKPDIDTIIQHTDEYINALVLCQAHTVK